MIDLKEAYQLGYNAHKTGMQNPYWVKSRPSKEFSRGQAAAMHEMTRLVFCLVDFSSFLTKNREYVLLRENESSYVILDNNLDEIGFQKSYFILCDNLD